MQKLRGDGSSALATIPKRYLERDGVLEDGEVPDDQNIAVDRLDERAYVVLVDGEDGFPDLSECERVRQMVAEKLLDQDALGQRQRAD